MTYHPERGPIEKADCSADWRQTQMAAHNQVVFALCKDQHPHVTTAMIGKQKLGVFVDFARKMSLARKRPESVAADMPAALRTINKLLSMFGYKPLKSRQRGMDTLNQKQRNCLGFQVSPVPWSGTSNSFHQGHKVRRVTHLDGHPANNGPRRFQSNSS